MHRKLTLLVLLLASGCDGDTTTTPYDAGSPLGSGETGAPCRTAADCVAPNDECVTVAGPSMEVSFDGGYCSMSCTDVGTDCGMNGVCDAFPALAYNCFRRCATDADCRESEGYTCQSGGLSTSELICLPPWSGT